MISFQNYMIIMQIILEWFFDENHQKTFILNNHNHIYHIIDSVS